MDMNTKNEIKSAKFDKENLLLNAEIRKNLQIDINSIEYISAENVVSRIFLKDKTVLRIRKSLNEWEKILPLNIFVRTNRNVIVNLKHVKLIEKSIGQTMKLIMQYSNKTLVMSRSYTKKLKKILIV